jgi:hypothetical protein
VCEHVARQRCPILSAFRTPPESPEDSGWQFFCGTVKNEDPEGAQVWLLDEVLELEPLLEQYIDLTPGIQVWRPTPEGEWKVRKLE